MRGRTWLPAKQKPPSKPKVPGDVREAVDALVAPVVANLKKRYCKTPKSPQFNWLDDLFTRWHRDALYFVVLMRTPHGRPLTFETHAARMEHAGDGKFNLAVPMRRGWNTIKKDATGGMPQGDQRVRLFLKATGHAPNHYSRNHKGTRSPNVVRS